MNNKPLYIGIHNPEKKFIFLAEVTKMVSNYEKTYEKMPSSVTEDELAAFLTDLPNLHTKNYDIKAAVLYTCYALLKKTNELNEDKNSYVLVIEGDEEKLRVQLHCAKVGNKESAMFFFQEKVRESNLVTTV